MTKAILETCRKLSVGTFVLGLGVLSSCGIPSAGCGDGVVCLEDGATTGEAATASDIKVGKYSYSPNGEIIVGKLQPSSLLRSTALRSFTTDTSKFSSQWDDATRGLSSIYSLIPNISTSVHGDSSGVTPVDASTLSTCGTSQSTVEARIKNCNTTWNGRLQAHQAEGAWSLVTKTSGGKVVWRDDSTGLIWSDSLSSSANWCLASGSSEGACAPGDGQSTPPQSLCAEASGLTTPSSDAKGLLTLAANNVAWRLPSKADWLQAELNGIRWVFGSMDPKGGPVPPFVYWSSTPLGIDYAGTAWTFNSWGGLEVVTGNMSVNHSVMCIGGYTPGAE